MLKKYRMIAHRFLSQCFVSFRKQFNKQKDALLFLKTLIRSPRTTGAILPSSQWLAKRMVSPVVVQEGIVVELGAGTGVMTAALLAAGVSPQKIFVIEYSPELATQLKKRFPDVNIIEGDAAHLLDLLPDAVGRVDTVLSSLPLRSLPKPVADAVLQQIPKALSQNGRYIQFTYDIRSTLNYYPAQYQLIKSSIVWLNIPPAKVEVFTIR